jgi:hypothetical protein
MWKSGCRDGDCEVDRKIGMLGEAGPASAQTGQSQSRFLHRKSCICYSCILQVVEKALQQTKDFDRLSFLYLTTGSTDKLSKMQKIADARGDPMSRFHNALYAGDVESRIAVMREVGLRECEVHARILDF